MSQFVSRDWNSIFSYQGIVRRERRERRQTILFWRLKFNGLNILILTQTLPISSSRISFFKNVIIIFKTHY